MKKGRTPRKGVEVLSVEKYNTNNDWGFGGGIGTRTTYMLPDGMGTLFHKKGTACFRHLPPERYESYGMGEDFNHGGRTYTMGELRALIFED
jgi:hypothetical protein